MSIRNLRSGKGKEQKKRGADPFSHRRYKHVLDLAVHPHGPRQPKVNIGGSGRRPTLARSRGHLAQSRRGVARSVVPNDVGVVVGHFTAGSPRVAKVQWCGLGTGLLLLLLHVVERQWPATASKELGRRRAVVKVGCSSVSICLV